MLTISIDMTATQKMLAEAQKQIPYATSRAINQTLKDAQTAIVSNIKTAMTIRNQAFVKFSVKLTKQARKHDLEGILAISDLPNKQSADILSKFDFTSTITRKEPQEAHLLAVPTEAVRPTKESIIPRSMYPKNMLDAVKMLSRSGVPILAAPLGRGKHRQITTAYLLVQSVPIPHLFNFYQIGERVITATFQQNWDIAFNQAMATAK